MWAPVVIGCVPASAMTWTRSGALWRAPPPCFADGRVYELACRIVAADAQGPMVRSFLVNACTRIWHVVERALIRWGVAVSLG